MPTYQYQCTECGEGLEAVQKFTDDALTECPSCQGRLKKVFSAVGIVFKGSGFYRNDSRGSSSSSSPASKPAADSGAKSADSAASSGSSSSGSSGGSSGSGSTSTSGASSSSTSTAGAA
ncbi:FmdB family zinc ribbon protein [Streptomyces physcomitrii]|uniref:FmdB family transcriptional regulator n=1 Tax=Streptomyces physcomitrii TaxID=2724184 RepID=A0ABX1H7W8_9ACTN|nr:FmdB family zinc ribbon protein [Streptomyces physcomitrii]NKI43339.1 FmdB family transcriptional regulator [Streptomyces physcomitrii]